jgi:hypothetical protein
MEGLEPQASGMAEQRATRPLTRAGVRDKAEYCRLVRASAGRFRPFSTFLASFFSRRRILRYTVWRYTSYISRWWAGVAMHGTCHCSMYYVSCTTLSPPNEFGAAFSINRGLQGMFGSRLCAVYCIPESCRFTSHVHSSTNGG